MMCVNLKTLFHELQDTADLKDFGFKILDEIGTGAFAKVKKVLWTEGQNTKTIAVKIVDLEKASSDYRTKLMPREIKIWPKMKHSNIIQIYATIGMKKRMYFFMELAENGDVVEYLRKNGPVTEDTAKVWINQLLQALRYMHTLGIAHRDLKCENLLLDSNMHVKLTDFGFARYCIDHDKHSRILSTTFCGSTAYVAPEVLRQLPYNPLRADVWSVGVCLYVMVNNCTPFDDTNLPRLLQMQESKHWRFRSSTKMSHHGRDFVKRALEPNVLKRPTLYALADHIWFRRHKF